VRKHQQRERILQLVSWLPTCDTVPERLKWTYHEKAQLGRE